MRWASRSTRGTAACWCAGTRRIPGRRRNSSPAPCGPAHRRAALLLDLDPGVLDDGAVARLLAAHERRHLVRRAGGGIHAERDEALLQVGRLHRLLDFRRDALDDFARRAARRDVAAPGHAI